MEVKIPYRSFSEAMQDKFSKWPTNKVLTSPLSAVWNDMQAGLRGRLKRAADNASQREALQLGKELLKQKEAEKTNRQLKQA